MFGARWNCKATEKIKQRTSVEMPPTLEVMEDRAQRKVGCRHGELALFRDLFLVLHLGAWPDHTG